MKVYNEIKEMLCEELEDVVKKRELTSNSLEMVDTAIDIIKDIDTIVAMEQEYGYSQEGGYSQGYYGRMPYYIYDDPGMSYARGRSNNVRGGRSYNDGYARNNGGYSGDTREELQRLMSTAKNDRERETLRNALENMNR